MTGNNSSSTAFMPPFICSTPLLVFSNQNSINQFQFSLKNQNPVHPNSTFAQLVSPCLANLLLPSMSAIFALFCVIFIWFIGRSKFFGQPASKPVAKSKFVYAKLVNLNCQKFENLQSIIFKLIPLLDLAASLLELFIIFAHSNIPDGKEWAAREFQVQAIANVFFSVSLIYNKNSHFFMRKYYG